MYLPKVDEPMRIQGNKTFVDCYERKEIEQEKHNHQLEELEPIEIQSIKCISDKSNIIRFKFTKTLQLYIFSEIFNFF